jgi:hypothetical protein
LAKAKVIEGEINSNDIATIAPSFFCREKQILGCMCLTVVILQFLFVPELHTTFIAFGFFTKKIELH